MMPRWKVTEEIGVYATARLLRRLAPLAASLAVESRKRLLLLFTRRPSHIGIARFFLSRISPSTVKISTDGYTWGPTQTVSQPGDAILNAFVIAGE
jgi:hypothetical protein